MLMSSLAAIVTASIGMRMRFRSASQIIASIFNSMRMITLRLSAGITRIAMAMVAIQINGIFIALATLIPIVTDF